MSQILSRMVLHVMAGSSSSLLVGKAMMPEGGGVGVRGVTGLGGVSSWGWHSGHAKVL